MRIASRRVLLADGRIAPATLAVEGDRIAAVERWSAAGALDLGDRLILPGIVDLHGDAFERQVMPRPGVMVDPAVGLADTDRQLLANGVTTAFHGLTWSWEPGLRSAGTGRALMATLDRLRPTLGSNHRWHLRFEIHNLDGLAEAEAMVGERRVGLLAFNDHTPAMAAAALEPTGNIGNAYRAQVPVAAFNELALAAHARAAEVEAGLLDLAAAWRLVSANPARAAGLADRGAIATGLRADLAVVEDDRGLPPRVAATMVGGVIAFEVRPGG